MEGSHQCLEQIKVEQSQSKFSTWTLVLRDKIVSLSHAWHLNKNSWGEGPGRELSGVLPRASVECFPALICCLDELLLTELPWQGACLHLEAAHYIWICPLIRIIGIPPWSSHNLQSGYWGQWKNRTSIKVQAPAFMINWKSVISSAPMGLHALDYNRREWVIRYSALSALTQYRLSVFLDVIGVEIGFLGIRTVRQQ